MSSHLAPPRPPAPAPVAAPARHAPAGPSAGRSPGRAGGRSSGRTAGRLATGVAGLVAVVGVVVITGGFVRVAADRPATAVLALLALVVGGTVLLRLPRHLLPAVALTAFAVIPLQLLPSQGVNNVLRPALLVLYVWVLRRWWERTPPDAADPHPAERRFTSHALVYVFAALLVLWLVLTVGWSVAPTTSTSWSLGFTASFFVPLLVFDARAEARALRTCFLWLGGALGAYAVLEQLLQTSPLMNAVYAAAGVTNTEVWAVYRSEAAFGHPLFAGAFLAVPAVLGIGSWLQSGRTRDGALGALAALGTVMTVSRGPMLAVGVGVLAAVLGVLATNPRPAGRRLLAMAPLVPLAFVGLSVFAPLTARADSVESGLSADVRSRAIDIALQAAAASGYLGTGPATSGISGRRIDDIVIENSLLQLLISIGVPGLLLFLLLVTTLCTSALGRRDVAVAAAIVAYVVAITGFNSLDAVRGMHVVLGFLLLLALNGRPAPPGPPGGGGPAGGPDAPRPSAAAPVGAHRSASRRSERAVGAR